MKLKIENLGVVYNAGEITEKSAICGFNLIVEAGQPVVIHGDNGSGKTTLLKAVAGEIKPNAGRVTLESEEGTTLPLRSDGIGYIQQKPMEGMFSDLTAAENLTLAAGARRLRWFDPYVRSSTFVDIERGIQQYCSFYEEVRNRRLSTLSVGQAQMLAVSSLLISRKEVMLFDEPSSALDRRNTEWLVGALKLRLLAPNVLSIIVSHDQNLIKVLGFRTIEMQAE